MAYGPNQVSNTVPAMAVPGGMAVPPESRLGNEEPRNRVRVPVQGAAGSIGIDGELRVGMEIVFRPIGAITPQVQVSITQYNTMLATLARTIEDDLRHRFTRALEERHTNGTVEVVRDNAGNPVAVQTHEEMTLDTLLQQGSITPEFAQALAQTGMSRDVPEQPTTATEAAAVREAVHSDAQLSNPVGRREDLFSPD